MRGEWGAGRDKHRRWPGGTDDDERYDYAADGTRLRKTRRREVAGQTETIETVYLDGCELRRITVTSVILERWTSHVHEGEQRVASIYRWDTDTFARETERRRRAWPRIAGGL